MSARRTPTAKAVITGAVARHPERFRDRLAGRNDRRPLGDPPARLTPAQADAWREFAADLPWLARQHRAIVGLACRMQSRIEDESWWGVSALSAYSAILSKLGATPVDDSRVSMPAGEDDADDEKFFGRAQ